MFEESMHAARYYGNKTTFFVALSHRATMLLFSFRGLRLGMVDLPTQYSKILVREATSILRRMDTA